MIEFAEDGPRHILYKFEKFEFFGWGGGGGPPSHLDPRMTLISIMIPCLVNAICDCPRELFSRFLNFV